MSEASGEDLTWFWREWFYENWLLDQAESGVAYVNQDSIQGALITLTNNSQAALPATAPGANIFASYFPRIWEWNAYGAIL